jgi:EAL and modified HD-GYP domain-containing signal transduction protein
LNKFIARQPILDKGSKTYGYELLFRSGLETFFHCSDPDQASASVVIDSFLLFGMQTLTHGRKAFINFTRNLILGRFATLLPKDQIIIEILEDVEPDAEVVAACKFLKNQGYTLALDDFKHSEGIKALVDLADIIKVDFLTTPVAERRSLAKSLSCRRVQLLAEKVETPEQYREAFSLGYHYFQGYFFNKPETVLASEIPACKLNYIMLLKAINRPEPDFTEIEGIIKREPSLTYRLLRYLNSAAFVFSKDIKSLRHALSLLGLQEVRKWISMVSLAGVAEDRPGALLTTTVTRARFCELLAPLAGYRNKVIDLFLIGLFSLIDVILGRPLAEILQQISVSEEVRSTLLHGNTPMKKVLGLAIACEEGEWSHGSRLIKDLRLKENEVSDAYLKAIEWSQTVLQTGNPRPDYGVR